MSALQRIMFCGICFESRPISTVGAWVRCSEMVLAAGAYSPRSHGVIERRGSGSAGHERLLVEIPTGFATLRPPERRGGHRH